MNHIYSILKKKEPWKPFHKNSWMKHILPTLVSCMYDEIEHKLNLTHERVQLEKSGRDRYNTYGWKIEWEEPKG